jgi:hypothetical protein
MKAENPMKKISLSRLRVVRLLCGRSAGPSQRRPALDPQALRVREHTPRTSDLRIR